MTPDQFRDARQAIGSQAKAAPIIGVSRWTLIRIESGQKGNPIPDKYKHMILGLARKGGEQ